MDIKRIHGKVFKQIREGRGVKLKDAAEDAISVRTLIRFEADETSVSLEIFEQLLRNIGVSYHDYFSEYIPLVGFDISEFLREVRNLDSSGSTTAIRSLAVKSLQKDKISMNERLYRYCTQKIGQNIQLFLFSILNFKVSKFYYF